MSSLTYVYCLVRSARRPSLRGIPPGMPAGGEVRILEVPESGSRSGGGRRTRTAQPALASRVAERPDRDWIVVSTVPERDYGEAPLERGLQQLEWVAPRALAHEAVVEHFLAEPALLPMQLFTMFISDERAVEHVIRDKRRIAGILKQIEGQVEWGLRLTLDPEAEALAGDRKSTAPYRRGSPQASKGPAREATSGADYLARKRDQLDLARTRLKKARTEANRLYKAVSREATDASRRTATEQAAPGSRLLLDAAFLVPARRAAAFRTAVGRHARALKGAGVTVSLTGPWPAYNFI